MTSAVLAWMTLGGPGAHAHGNTAHAASGRRVIDRTQQAWGRGGDPREATRHVRIDMHDSMRFSPDRLKVRVGQTLRIAVRNRGRVQHELVIGTRQELQRHAEMMRQHPDMEHDEPYMAHVPPGRQADLVWQFNRPGQFMFGCLVAGHWDAGMLGHITVE